jgi:hypothetical protein
MGVRYGDLTLYRRLLVQARPSWPHIACLFGLSLLRPQPPRLHRPPSLFSRCRRSCSLIRSTPFEDTIR